MKQSFFFKVFKYMSRDNVFLFFLPSPLSPSPNSKLIFPPQDSKFKTLTQEPEFSWLFFSNPGSREGGGRRSVFKEKRMKDKNVLLGYQFILKNCFLLVVVSRDHRIVCCTFWVNTLVLLYFLSIEQKVHFFTSETKITIIFFYNMLLIVQFSHF